MIKTRTATHEFYIYKCVYATSIDEALEVRYRPLHLKTGQPWQASRRVTDGATIEPEGWAGRPIAYPTVRDAEAARDRQIKKLEKGRGR